MKIGKLVFRLHGKVLTNNAALSDPTCSVEGVIHRVWRGYLARYASTFSVIIPPNPLPCLDRNPTKADS